MGFVLLASVAGAYGMKEDRLFQSAITCVEQGNTKELQSLLDENPAMINEANKYDGRTLLHVASIHNKIDMIDLLLNRGATIDQKDKAGCTALLVAVLVDNEGSVGKLISRGANIIESDNYGRTPLRVPPSVNNPFLNEQAKTTQLLQQAKDAAALDENPNMINKITVADATSLHLAVMKGNTNRVKRLLKKGVKINQQDRLGDTALHVAIRNGFNEIVDCLLKNGANILISNNDGYTPLFMANDFKTTASPKKKATISTLIAAKHKQLLAEARVASESTAVQPSAAAALAITPEHSTSILYTTLTPVSQPSAAAALAASARGAAAAIAPEHNTSMLYTTLTPTAKASVAAALAASASGKVSIKDLSTEELLRRQDRLLNKLNLISQELNKRHTTSPL